MKKVKFVIHDHKALRAGYHQDIRFEDPQNKKHWHSFAVPKGVPLKPGTRVLAIKTHIHTKDEALFQGDIEAGEYGGGNLSLFDQGIAGLEKFTSAHIVIILQGQKAKGIYHFVSIGNVDTKKYKQQQYLLFKSKTKVTAPLNLSPREISRYKSQLTKINKLLESFKQ